MTSCVLTSENFATDELALTSAASPVVRTPFYWESQGSPLFGWLHTSQGVIHDQAVLIAPPLGYEQLHAHRGLRHLADELARAGFPTLRFDWHGTGNSPGLDEDQHRLTTWRENLRDAVRQLKQMCGVTRVSVVGLRLGATLAATSLTAEDIDRLVLWAPVVSGRSYVREMTAIDLTSEIPSSRPAGQPGDLEPGGFVLAQQTADELSKLNLLQAPLCRARTLIIGRNDLPADQRLHAAYSAAGLPFEQQLQPGYCELMAEPHRGDVPRQAIRAIVNWLSTESSTITTEEPHIPGDLPQNISLITRPEGTLANTQPQRAAQETEIRERIWQINTSPHLFGILSEPTGDVSEARPTIVILNAGATSHIGPGRMHVHLARQLAANGFRSLRLDLNGLGDSIHEDQSCENDSYSATVFRDIEITLRTLQQQQLGQRFVLLGLCSGAYAAFQSAVSLTDPALVESVLINPLTFYWREGMTIDDAAHQELREQHYYWDSALDFQKWRRLLTGQSQLGWRGVARVVWRKLGWSRTQPAAAADETMPESAPSSTSVITTDNSDSHWSHPEHDDLPCHLAQAATRGRQVSFFFADTDPGYRLLQHKARRRVRQLQRSGQLSVEFLTQSDHTFSRRSARTVLLAALTKHLLNRYSHPTRREKPATGTLHDS